MLKYHPAVLKEDLPRLDRQMKQRVRLAIEEKLMTHPDLFGIPLRQSLHGHRKLRVGDYRIVFRIERRIIFILAVLHRSIVYQEVGKRIL